MKDSSKERIATWQWLIGHSRGKGLHRHFRLTDKYYATKEEVMQYEVVTANCSIIPLKRSSWNMLLSRYQEMHRQYPADSEYSRQIHHSGGCSGHSYGR